MEIPIQLDEGGRTLLGMLHLPRQRAEGNPLILLAYGLNGDRVDNHRLSILLANQANAAGVSVVRFSSNGCGLSSREFHETSIATKVADTLAVIDFVKGCHADEPFKLVLLGYSDGIRVVHHVLQRRRDVSAIALWNPTIRSMTDTFQPKERGKMQLEPATRKLVFPLFGVYLGMDYLREANQHLDPREVLGHDVPKLFVFGTGDVHTRSFQEELQALRAEGARFDLREIEGANHLFSRAAWSEEVVARTVEWVLET
jgi:uncharacterized protein